MAIYTKMGKIVRNDPRSILLSLILLCGVLYEQRHTYLCNARGNGATHRVIRGSLEPVAEPGYTCVVN
jgi:hypothetical protein